MNNRMKIATALVALTALSGCGLFGGRDNKTPVVGNRVPILASDTALVVDPSIAAVPVTLPAASPNADWTQPGGNAAKSMGHLALAASPARAWSVRIPGSNLRERLAAAPVVGGGRIFVVDVTGTVHAFDAASGGRVWQTSSVEQSGNENSRFGGGVSFDEGRVYATNGLGDVVALDAATGAVQWRVRPGGPLRGAPTLANGQVYVQSNDNQLFALNMTDGSRAWNAAASPESQGLFGRSAPAVARGTIVAGFSSGELNAYRYENGLPLWSDALSRTSISTSVSALADIAAEPVIDNDRVYAIGQGGRAVAVDLLTGRRVWEQNIAGTSTPWIVGEWMFVVTDDARLIAIARDTGRVRWVSQLPAFRNVRRSRGPIDWVGPVLAGGRLIVVSSEGQIASVNPADGAIGATIEGSGAYTLAPVVANGTLFLLDDDGNLSAWR